MSYTEFVKRTVTVFGLIALFLGLWHLRTIIMLFFLSAIIAVSLAIPVNRLERMGVRRSVAITFTLMVTLLVLVLLATSVLPVFVRQTLNVVADFPTTFDDLTQTYNEWHGEQSAQMRSLLPKLNLGKFNDFVQDASASISPALLNVGNVVANSLFNLIFILIISVFLLLDPLDYARGAVLLTPSKYRKRMLEVLVELRDTLTAWLTALTFSITVTIFLVWLLLGLLLGVPNALVLGVFAGFMTIIPNLGAVIPLIPIVIFTLADDPGKLPLAVIAYMAIQQVESNVLTPSVVKRQLNIPAAVVLVFQLVSAVLFGFLGVLLAVPLLATLITLVRELYVYDTLGMRGVDVIVEQQPSGVLRLVTHHPNDETYELLTDNYRLMTANLSESPPEDWPLHPESGEE